MYVISRAAVPVMSAFRVEQAQSSTSLSTEMLPQGEAWSLDMLVAKVKNSLFSVLLSLFLCISAQKKWKFPRSQKDSTCQ